MQAIHNASDGTCPIFKLFQRAKIQDKCKQFTTVEGAIDGMKRLFQRAKIQDKCKQFTTTCLVTMLHLWLFQRAKIQDKCKQFTTYVSDW